MKLAVVSESPADEAAVRILVHALLGETAHVAEFKSIRHRHGCSSIPLILPAVCAELHYNTDADALAVVIDSNGTPLHTEEHDPGECQETRCRLCTLRQTVAEAMRRLRHRPVGQSLSTAFGLASPAIEAWYMCGLDPRASEATWARDLRGGVQARQRVRELKRAAYGIEEPLLAQETRVAQEHARRLAANLAILEEHFPSGFGALARDVRNWRTTS